MMPMGDPGELEYGYRADALKEGWKARVGTHKYPECPLTVPVPVYARDLNPCGFITP